MGVTITKYCDEKTSFRRLRLVLKTSKVGDSNSTKQVSHWGRLPYVVMVDIYSYLSKRDRFHVSLTCKAWNLPFSRPEVWRRTKFLFDSIEDWRAMHFVGPLVSGLRSLVVDCQRNNCVNISRSSRGSMNSLYKFLDGLIKCKNCSLVELRLINIMRLSRWFQWYRGQDILQVLGDLLCTQTNLRLLDLSRAGFDNDQGIYLLSRIATTCGATITVLVINDFFSRLAVPRITKWLQAFTNLAELSLNYQYLSDDLLNALAVCGSLVLLNVAGTKNVVRAERINDGWQNVLKSIPALQARYTIHEDCGHFTLLKNILTPGIPLVSLELCWQDLSFHWKSFCKLIASCFMKHLRRLSIELCSSILRVDHFLDIIIESCLILEEISVKNEIDSLSVRNSMKRSIRRAIVGKKGRHVRSFTFNGIEVDLDLSWIDYIFYWLL